MKLLLTVVSIASLVIGVLLQSGPSPTSPPSMAPSPTSLTALSPGGPPESDGPYPRVRSAHVPTPEPLPPAAPPAPPTVTEIADAVGRKTEALIRPVIADLTRLKKRVDGLEELIGQQTDAVRHQESLTTRTLAEYRAEINQLRASIAELQSTVTRDRNADRTREPDPAVAKLTATIDTLAETVAKLQRRIEDLKTAPKEQPKPDPKPEPKTDRPPSSPGSSRSWNTEKSETKVMPPCGRGLVTVEISPEVGHRQLYFCPHCPGATFHATVIGTAPLRVQTSRP